MLFYLLAVAVISMLPVTPYSFNVPVFFPDVVLENWYWPALVPDDILFPPIFDKLKWNNEVLLDFFYAEKNGKPYLITETGFIIDPAGDHLPKPTNRIDNFAWDGPKDTICDGCIFADSISPRGEGCGKLSKEDFRNNVIKGSCKHYKHDEQALSYQEKRDKYQEKKQPTSSRKKLMSLLRS